MHRVGAAQFQRGRNAIGFGIPGISRQTRPDLVGGPNDGIEAAEHMIAVERGADLVLEFNARQVETASPRDRKRIRDVERVECVEAAVLVGGSKRDRADRNGIAGLSEKYGAAADDVV